jgi:hypothetical protein
MSLAVKFSHDPAVTDSLRQWRGRQVFPTEFGSAELRGFSAELRMRSVFSARCTNADFLHELARVCDDVISGKSNEATARWELMKKLKVLGYDPEKGFPQDMASVPPAEKDSLQDLSSKRRLDLMVRTNVSLTRNFARVTAGNAEWARVAYPAWELKRTESRVTPRGTPDSHSVGWERRWSDAGASVNWAGALQHVMVARKDSPIWEALGDGEGGYADTLGHPFAPFAFGSGYDQVAVSRGRWETLLGDARALKDEGGRMKDEVPAPSDFSIAPTVEEINASLDRLKESPDLWAAFKASLAE